MFWNPKALGHYNGILRFYMTLPIDYNDNTSFYNYIHSIYKNLRLFYKCSLDFDKISHMVL